MAVEMGLVSGVGRGEQEGAIWSGIVGYVPSFCSGHDGWMEGVDETLAI